MASSSNYQLKAFILGSSGDYISDIKRLALFFDEIILPPVRSPAISGSRVSEKRGPNLVVDSAQAIEDIYRYPIETTSDQKEKEILLTFKENSIVTELPIQAIADLYRAIEGFPEIRRRIVSMEIQDDEFISLSNTTREDIAKPPRVQLEIISTSGESHYILSLPQAVNDSHSLTTHLCLSHQLGYSPVFLSSRFAKELHYRYERYKKGLTIIDGLCPGLLTPDDFKAHFGQITFDISYGLFSSDAISCRTVSEIIKYRNSMQEARNKWTLYVLSELQSLIKDNPWSERTKMEIERFIRGKLAYALAEYASQSKEIWEKLFGRLAVNSLEVTKASIIGGTVGGIVGKLIPNASTLEMALLGVLVAIGRESPKLIQSIVDTVLEQRKKKRNAVAYIAKFSDR